MNYTFLIAYSVLHLSSDCSCNKPAVDHLKILRFVPNDTVTSAEAAAVVGFYIVASKDFRGRPVESA